MDDLNDSDEVVDAASAPNTAGLHMHKLSIVSYGHANGPLEPSPSEDVEQLTFSVRDIKNPPVKLRKKHTGLTSRLRKEVFAEEAARTRLDEMAEAVESKMAEMSRVNVEAKSPDQQSSQSPPVSTLFVGIMCEEGKHRSVAFAEELARKIKPWDVWAISVEHRDLGIPPLNTEDQDSEKGKPPSKAIHKSKKQREQDKKRVKNMLEVIVNKGLAGRDASIGTPEAN
ncbi:hypothetical protein H2200_001417 [Cladophialophora chaetospira]|uniref:RapZ C-terminal domain-containing protein n=1 Tax=Cladophialophora chaetospira TaxID=386627 RepID=A0AA38XKU4_9EURO|nr:hypothetical protein H2200_001417 [Cladophialophora chaetospira]